MKIPVYFYCVWNDRELLVLYRWCRWYLDGEWGGAKGWFCGLISMGARCRNKIKNGKE